MTITRENWQDALRKAIKTYPEKYKRVGINSIYTIIAALALLPVAVAGEEWGAALITLIGSVGANVVSDWLKDTKDGLDVARKIENLHPNDPIQKHIQELLNKLDAFNIAHQGLPEPDWIRLEALLDQKFSQYGAGAQKIPLKLDAPILIENVDKPHAREIGYSAIKKAWWSERGIGKSRLEIQHWPIAFYDARYLVKYQQKHTEDVRNEKNEKIGTRTYVTDETSDSTIQIVTFPSTALNRMEQLLPERVCESLNSLRLEKDLNWGRNNLARITYDYLCVPLINFWPHREKVKKVRYWEKYKYLTRIGSIVATEKNIIEEAQHLAKRSIVNRLSSSQRSVRDISFGQEKIRVAQYPFWIFQVDSKRGTSQIIIEGLGGNIVFMHVPANKISHVLVSTLGIIAIAIILSLVIFIIYSLIPMFSY